LTAGLRITTTPQRGRTVFTDASSTTHMAVVVWQENSKWLRNRFVDPEASVQQLEAKAVAEAFSMWPDESLNVVTDSMFVYKLVQSMATPGWAGSELAILFETALQQRQAPAAIIHVRSHTSTPGYFQEGNQKADQAAKGIWTLAEARDLHVQLHLGAKALAKQCRIPLTQAREIVATCPYCQN
ncbi:POL1 protein, partial [Probosciger aterrimus]|nr:POL1 protein [Probosciger aterrimus]